MPVELTDKLLVHSVFKTIQGEGPFVGRNAIFIRLAGCNLQCPFCDTDYTSRSTSYSIMEDVEPCLEDLVATLGGMQPIRNAMTVVAYRQLVVITGGEPFRQRVHKLVERLLVHGYQVQIETNGTLPPVELSHNAHVVCSPKTPKIDEELAMRANCYKYVLDAAHVDETDGLPAGTLGKYGRTARPPRDWVGDIYVQPMDSGDATENAANLAACVASCMRYGYRLGVQIHKIANLE